MDILVPALIAFLGSRTGLSVVTGLVGLLGASGAHALNFNVPIFSKLVNGLVARFGPAPSPTPAPVPASSLEQQIISAILPVIMAKVHGTDPTQAILAAAQLLEPVGKTLILQKFPQLADLLSNVPVPPAPVVPVVPAKN